MNFGELIYHGGAGFIFGLDTDRLIAEFEYSSEAESFVESYNKSYKEI